MVANVVPLDLDTGRREESKQGVREERREQKENKQRQEEGSLDCGRKDRGKKE